jgi:hypothetical protein
MSDIKLNSPAGIMSAVDARACRPIFLDPIGHHPADGERPPGWEVGSWSKQ